LIDFALCSHSFSQELLGYQFSCTTDWVKLSAEVPGSGLALSPKSGSRPSTSTSEMAPASQRANDSMMPKRMSLRRLNSASCSRCPATMTFRATARIGTGSRAAQRSITRKMDCPIRWDRWRRRRGRCGCCRS
jgi:hypothetical protein